MVSLGSISNIKRTRIDIHRAIRDVTGLYEWAVEEAVIDVWRAIYKGELEADPTDPFDDRIWRAMIPHIRKAQERFGLI